MMQDGTGFLWNSCSSDKRLMTCESGPSAFLTGRLRVFNAFSNGNALRVQVSMCHYFCRPEYYTIDIAHNKFRSIQHDRLLNKHFQQLMSIGIKIIILDRMSQQPYTNRQTRYKSEQCFNAAMHSPQMLTKGFKYIQLKIEKCNTRSNFNANGSKTYLLMLQQTINSVVPHFQLSFTHIIICITTITNSNIAKNI